MIQCSNQTYSTSLTPAGLGDSFNKIEKHYGKPTLTNQSMTDRVVGTDTKMIFYRNIAYQQNTQGKNMSMQSAGEFAKDMEQTGSVFVKVYDEDENDHYFGVPKNQTDGTLP